MILRNERRIFPLLNAQRPAAECPKPSDGRIFPRPMRNRLGLPTDFKSGPDPATLKAAHNHNEAHLASAYRMTDDN
jgi:hypothetical protein